LINLVGNVIKFTKKGQVDISLRYKANDGKLQFDITDIDIGMSDDQKSRLFKPFCAVDSSVSRHFGGTGLGLAISRRLAKMLGGNVRAESKLGEASKFIATIRTGSIYGVELVEPTTVIDDRRDIRFLSRRILSEAGANVDEAEDGQIALDFIRERLAEGNPPDLILLEMQMPNLDGYETAKRMRASGFVGPIIA
jgi:hypothetical protein